MPPTGRAELDDRALRQGPASEAFLYSAAVVGLWPYAWVCSMQSEPNVSDGLELTPV